MSAKQDKITTPSEGAEKLAKLKHILQVVSSVDLKKLPVWDEIKARGDKVDIRAVNAEADSVTVDGNKFSGLFRLNLLVTFSEDGEEFRSSDYAIGRFAGAFTRDGSPEIKEISLDGASEEGTDDSV